MDPEGSRVAIRYYDNGVERYYYYSGSESSVPDNYYLQSFIQAYEYNRDNWEKAGLDGVSPSTKIVENEDITIYIYEDPTVASQFIPGNGGIPQMIWNPYEATQTNNGIVLSPATILAHESDHALSFLTDPVAHSNRKRLLRNDGYTNEEEFRVINGSEQKTAFANGEISRGGRTRRDHFGKTVYTASSTSNIIDWNATRYYLKYILKK